MTENRCLACGTILYSLLNKTGEIVRMEFLIDVVLLFNKNMITVPYEVIWVFE